MPKEDQEQKPGELINTVRLEESLDESLNKKDKVEILKDHIRNQEDCHFGSQGKRRYQSDWNPGFRSDWEKVTPGEIRLPIPVISIRDFYEQNASHKYK